MMIGKDLGYDPSDANSIENYAFRLDNQIRDMEKIL